MIEWFHLILVLIAQLVAAGAVYGGIRADLRNMKDGIKEAKTSATDAHRRLDQHLDRRFVPREG